MEHQRLFLFCCTHLLLYQETKQSIQKNFLLSIFSPKNTNRQRSKQEQSAPKLDININRNMLAIYAALTTS